MTPTRSLDIRDGVLIPVIFEEKSCKLLYRKTEIISSIYLK